MISPATDRIYSVSGLSREIHQLLEYSFRQIWVEGEISSLTQAASGHLYFSLKENNTVLRCAFFKQRRKNSSCRPTEGMQVLLSARVSLYQNRGDMQLIVNRLEQAGEGVLRRAFEQLQLKLQQAGLFERQYKRSIPRLPQTIVAITSNHGAAIHDIRTTLKRRFPAARLLLYPTAVQGDEAVVGIVRMLELANQRCEAEVIILARGGGSLEDLKAFNDESVARAVFNSDLPIISGVGHESDTTITDLVADYRAPTPTAAAEAACQHQDELNLRFDTLNQRLQSSIVAIIRATQQRLDYLLYQLIEPANRLASLKQRLQQAVQRLQTANTKTLTRSRLQLIRTTALLQQSSPLIQLNRKQQLIQRQTNNLLQGVNTLLHRQRQSLAALSAKISVISPYQTLQRGYTILQLDDKVITTAKSVNPGQTLDAILAEGRLRLQVATIEPGNLS